MSAISTKLAEKLKNYTAYANDCIKLKFIHNENDLNEDSKAAERTSYFPPEYTHQIFGDDEIIFGYKDLKVKYYLTPGALHAYIGLAYSEKITPQRFDGIEADDIYDAFSKFGCSPGFTRSLDVFTSEKLKQDSEFRPYGFKIHEYSREVRNTDNNAAKKSMNYQRDNQMSKFEIYKVDSSCSEFHSQKFVDYLIRVQTMLVYYIEQASFVDTDDDQWTFYLLYEKKKKSQNTNSGLLSGSGSNDRYATIGYLSVYNYYAYPDKIRSRISQMLIFPPYQRNGHGATLMEAVYTDACKNSKVLDVTAESPSVDFMQLRDFVTSRMCMKLNAFKNVEQLRKGFNEDMIKEAMAAYKLPKLQSRRCYEILRLQATNENNEGEWRDYRLDVKKRLYKPFIQKNKFARNATTMNNDKNKEAEDKPMSSGSKLDSRFGAGSTSIGFGTGSTSIGFGSSNSATSTTTIGFGQPKPATSSKGGKTVSFAKPAFNNSYDEEEEEEEEENSEEHDDEDESDNEMDVSANSQYLNLFMNEQERKKYLDEQFNQSVEDYRKTLRRLDNQ